MCTSVSYMVWKILQARVLAETGSQQQQQQQPSRRRQQQHVGLLRCTLRVYASFANAKCGVPVGVVLVFAVCLKGLCWFNGFSQHWNNHVKGFSFKSTLPNKHVQDRNANAHINLQLGNTLHVWIIHWKSVQCTCLSHPLHLQTLGTTCRTVLSVLHLPIFLM